MRYLLDTNACIDIIKRRSERHGTPIGSLDLLIAAHALYLGCVLVTNNTRKFCLCPDLAIENWFE